MFVLLSGYFGCFLLLLLAVYLAGIDAKPVNSRERLCALPILKNPLPFGNPKRQGVFRRIPFSCIKRAPLGTARLYNRQKLFQRRSPFLMSLIIQLQKLLHIVPCGFTHLKRLLRPDEEGLALPGKLFA